jgi:hypothetical protein
MSNLKHIFDLKDKALYHYLHRKNIDYSEHNEQIKSFALERAALFFDEQMLSKVSSHRRSDKSDQAVIKDFQEFQCEYFEIKKDVNYQNALEWTRLAFKPHRILHPIAFPDLRYYPWTLGTNSGAPWNLQNWSVPVTDRNVDLESDAPKLSSTRDRSKWNHFFAFLNMQRTTGNETTFKLDRYLHIKQRFGLIDNDRRIKHNLYNETFVHNRYLIHLIKDGAHPFWSNGKPQTYYWHTLFARSHTVSHGEPDKIRAVFGATMLLLMAENMFVRNLQRSYQNEENRALLWGREIMNGGFNSLYHEFFATRATYITYDIHHFDKKAQHTIIDDVHSNWRSYFDFSHYEETNVYNGEQSKADPQRIQNLWDWMTHSVKHTPILLPDGTVWTWLHTGLASGFQQTQLLDSNVNSIKIITVLFSLGINCWSKHFKARFQGDDSLIRTLQQLFLQNDTYEQLQARCFVLQHAAMGSSEHFHLLCDLILKISIKTSEVRNPISKATDFLNL